MILDRHNKRTLALYLIIMGTLFAVAFNVRDVKAENTIIIWSDGHVSPSGSPILQDGNFYTLTRDYNGSISVSRDNAVVDGAGHTLLGSSPGGNLFSGTGIDVEDTTNTTVKNFVIRKFESGVDVWQQFGASSSNCVFNSNLTDNKYGVHILRSNNNEVRNNSISNNQVGIYIMWATNEHIFDNTITGSIIGIQFNLGGGNFVYHNNMLSNSQQFSEVIATSNTLDLGYPLGGNYYGSGNDYCSGASQNESGSDGICDHPFVITANETDHYPLMGYYHVYPVNQDLVEIISNSTTSTVQFNGSEISFKVTGSSWTFGFCRIAIPKSLLDEPYVILVNGTQVQYTLLPCSNSTHNYIFFTYHHSTEQITIAHTAIPEFPSSLMLVVLMISIMLAVTVCRVKSAKFLEHE